MKLFALHARKISRCGRPDIVYLLKKQVHWDTSLRPTFSVKELSFCNFRLTIKQKSKLTIPAMSSEVAD